MMLTTGSMQAETATGRSTTGVHLLASLVVHSYLLGFWWQHIACLAVVLGFVLSLQQCHDAVLLERGLQAGTCNCACGWGVGHNMRPVSANISQSPTSFHMLHVSSSADMQLGRLPH
jgi:hypothetical protein